MADIFTTLQEIGRKVAPVIEGINRAFSYSQPFSPAPNNPYIQKITQTMAPQFKAVDSAWTNFNTGIANFVNQNKVGFQGASQRYNDYMADQSRQIERSLQNFTNYKQFERSQLGQDTSVAPYESPLAGLLRKTPQGQSIAKAPILGDILKFVAGSDPKLVEIQDKLLSKTPLTEEEKMIAKENNFNLMAGLAMGGGTKIGRFTNNVEDVAKSGRFNVLKEWMNETRPQTLARQAQGISPQEAYGPGGRLVNDMKTAFQDWVNARSASKIQGVAKSREFAVLDQEGLGGLFKVQAGDIGGSIRNFFDEAYQKLRGAGIDVNYRENYLPQLWQNPEEEIKQVFGRTLGTKPGFTMERVVQDYKTGIQAGLTPRYAKVSDIAGWYEQRVNKALADKNFFTYLKDQDLIMPANKSPQGWLTLDPDRFPSFSTKLKDGSSYTGNYKAAPELANRINNYLKEPDGVIDKIADYASRIKNIRLSAGIPGTAWNAHGVNILGRNVMASKNPIEGFLRSVYYNTLPGQAAKTINLEKAAEASRLGLTLSTEDHILQVAEQASKGLVGKTIGKLSDLQKNLLEKPLFEQVIPSLKLRHWEDVAEDLIKNGVDEVTAKKKAAEIVNNIFGGINVDQIGRSRDLQAFLRSTILAPDWAESTIRTGAGVVKGLLHPGTPEYAAYRRIVRNLGLIYVGMNVLNKSTTGRYMWENDPGHTFEVEAGVTEDGKKRYIRPLGTSADFVRLPYDIVIGLGKGDPSSVFRTIANRLSIPVGTAVRLLTNVDYMGNPIYGQDKYGNPMSIEKSLGGIGSQIAGLGVPSYVTSGIDRLTGRINNEQFLTQAFEMPVRYSNQIYGKDAQAQFELMKQGGYTPAQAVDALRIERDQKQQKTEAKRIIESGSQNADMPTVHSYLKTDEILAMPRTNVYEEALFQEKAFGAVDNILKNEYLNGDQKSQALKDLGISPEQAQYYFVASQSEAARTAFIQQQLQGVQSNEVTQKLAILRTEINGRKILTNNVIDSLEAQGALSSLQSDALKRISINSQGQMSFKRPGLGRGRKATAMPKPKAFRLSYSSPNISVPKMTTPQISLIPLRRGGGSVLNRVRLPQLKLKPRSLKDPLVGLESLRA